MKQYWENQIVLGGGCASTCVLPFAFVCAKNMNKWVERGYFANLCTLMLVPAAAGGAGGGGGGGGGGWVGEGRVTKRKLKQNVESIFTAVEAGEP